METLGTGIEWLPPASQNVLELLKPATYTDAAALAVFAAASAAYTLRKYTWDKPDPFQHIWYERPQASDGAGSAARTTRNIAERLEELNKQVVIFWGSQSGTAEGLANRLARELHQRFRLEALSADLSDFDPETISQIPKAKTALFILSTYGEGDPSDNASTFWDWAAKLRQASLTSLQYAVFGLGNSDYKYYNRVADVVNQALHTAGAEQLLPIGRADDAHGTTEEDFLTWRDQLLGFLGKHLGLESQDLKYEPVYSVVEDESLEPQDLHNGEPVEQRDNLGKSAAGNSPIRPLKIKATRELFTNSTRNCMHLDVDITDHPQISYKTGDHMAVWPMNPDEEVERLIRVLGLSARRQIPISITSLDAGSKVRIPTPTTVETLFRHYLEICAPVSRNTARSLAEFVPSGAAKSFLLEVSKDRETFAQFIAATHVNLGRLLDVAVSQDTDAASPSIPLSFFIEVLPRMQPRFYSISSSSIVSPRTPSITVLVSNTEISEASTAPIPGLASNYLLALSQSTAAPEVSKHPAGLTYHLSGPGDALKDHSLFAHIVRSKFKLPAQASCPIIMVAAGTGLAPFRGFLSERSRLHAMGKPVGEMMLFYGCRSADEDNIYESELRELEQSLQGKLQVVRAFSRASGGKKVYVQDKVQEHGDEVKRLLGADASVYVCGRVSMAREVEKTVSNVWRTEKNLDDTAVKDWNNSMKRNRKWQEDVWG
ncbi:putative NADPH--cytochrome P450 reductase [Seiridium unicorne]|uniref:NADPH--cytochrome P450 reductase n=1 Tax=Seiridium unicorne TaxID=138068 RepID=A0ABR2UGY0_9PEZI